MQHHPLRGTVLHIDLHEVVETEKVTLVVPVETVGEPAGVKTGGGVLEHVLFKIKVRALPKDLPEVLQVDVSAMDVGQTIHVSDLKLDAGIEVLIDPKIVVLSVAGSRTAAQEEAEADKGGVATQPEMIKEKKEVAKGGKK